MARSEDLPNPKTDPELFDGILTRRILAYLVDFVIVMAITLGVILATAIAGIPTLGVAFIAFPVTLTLAVLSYYAATLGSPKRATIGMQLADIVLTPLSTPPLDGWKIIIHPILFWLTIWFVFPLLLIGLFTPRRQLIHDLVTGTLMLRRSPMQRHWEQAASFAG